MNTFSLDTKYSQIAFKLKSMKALFPIVKITYKGKPLGQKEYDEHPEIHHMYPSKEAFMQKIYLPILQKALETNSEQFIEISEKSIKINGTPFKLS